MTAGITSPVAPEVPEVLNDDVSLPEQERPELTVGNCGENVSMTPDDIPAYCEVLGAWIIQPGPEDASAYHTLPRLGGILRLVLPNAGASVHPRASGPGHA